MLTTTTSLHVSSTQIKKSVWKDNKMVLPEPLCEKVFLLGFVTNNKDKSDVKECFMACYILML